MLIAARNSMMAGKRLPYKKRVQYLETIYSTTNAPCWIDTGIYMDQDNDWVFSVDNATLRPSSWSNIFSFYLGEEYESTRVINSAINPYGQVYVGYRRKANSQQTIDLGFSVSERATYILSCMQLKYGRHGSPLTTVTILPPEGSYVRSTMCLFGRANSAYAGQQRCWGFSASKGGVPIRSLIPVIDWNDVPCFYDEVTGALFPSQGSSAFIAGPDIAGGA